MTPANGSVYKSPERAAGFFCHPFGVAFTPLTCRGSCVPSVANQRSWSGIPACGLISPSGFGGIFADNHKKIYNSPKDSTLFDSFFIQRANLFDLGKVEMTLKGRYVATIRSKISTAGRIYSIREE